MLKNVKLGRYLPRELIDIDGFENIKIIEPPKGKIPSKAAFELQRSIIDQLTPRSTSPVAESGRQMTYKK